MRYQELRAKLETFSVFIIIPLSLSKCCLRLRQLEERDVDKIVTAYFSEVTVAYRVCRSQLNCFQKLNYSKHLDVFEDKVKCRNSRIHNNPVTNLGRYYIVKLVKS